METEAIVDAVRDFLDEDDWHYGAMSSARA